jgi:predicted flap endonuclease-1-like 5' DNA nuclease
MSFVAGVLWWIVLGALIGWVAAWWLGRTSQRLLTEPVIRIVERRVDNPQHVARIAALEGEAARIAPLEAELARLPALEREAAAVPALQARVDELLAAPPRVVEKVVTRTLDRVIEKPVERIVEKIVEKPVDRVVERVVERTVPDLAAIAERDLRLGAQRRRIEHLDALSAVLADRAAKAEQAAQASAAAAAAAAARAAKDATAPAQADLFAAPAPTSAAPTPAASTPAASTPAPSTPAAATRAAPASAALSATPATAAPDETTLRPLRARIEHLQALAAVQAERLAEARETSRAAAAGFAAKGEADIELVEGIGPKIAELLRARGLGTFGALAQASPGTLREILDSSGPAYRIADPSTWPEQAQLAADGRWDELKSLQHALVAGRR